MLAQTIFALRSISCEIRFRIYIEHVGSARLLAVPCTSTSASKTRCCLLSRVRSATGTASQSTLTDPDLHAREKPTAAFLGRIQLAYGVRADIDIELQI